MQLARAQDFNCYGKPHVKSHEFLQGVWQGSWNNRTRDNSEEPTGMEECWFSNLWLCSSIFWLVVLCGYRAIHRRPAFSRTMWIPCHMHFCIGHSWFRRPHWCKWLPVEQTYCYGSLRFTSQRFPQGVGQGAMNQGTRGYCKLECVSSRKYVWWLLLFVGDIQRRPASSKTIWMPNHMYICAL